MMDLEDIRSQLKRPSSRRSEKSLRSEDSGLAWSNHTSRESTPLDSLKLDFSSSTSSLTSPGSTGSSPTTPYTPTTLPK